MRFFVKQTWDFFEGFNLQEKVSNQTVEVTPLGSLTAKACEKLIFHRGELGGETSHIFYVHPEAWGR